MNRGWKVVGREIVLLVLLAALTPPVTARAQEGPSLPAPRDDDWHWWGKLNDAGGGAVVVVRGSGGAERRAINIPWVKPEGSYRVVALFSERRLGDFTGRQLQAGAVELTLPVYGQEILELAPGK